MMRMMRLSRPGASLELRQAPVPYPQPGQVLVRVRACGVCRTDLHLADGDLPGGKLPIVPGHEIVGTVEACGAGVSRFQSGERVGVPWLGWTCGQCAFCLRGEENLCDRALFTGFHIDGGYGEFALADERYCFALSVPFDDDHAAPLLCAGLIGYRALVKAGQARRLGLFGFGAAAHIVAQVARFQGREVFAFTRPGDTAGQAFAMELGASWAGDSTQRPPELLDAAIIFAPVGDLVPAALGMLCKGGRLVCAGIHMTDIPAFRYDLLWGERQVLSVANLTRADAEAFLALVPRIGLRTEVEVLPLESANQALARLRHGEVRGAFVLRP
jgi:alcohol dehydrogenase, propanol-preferring